jgi:outer membrane receptor protein involved in Fe transport
LDYTHGRARSLTSGVSGQGGQWLVQPKGSVIIGPFAKSEFYVSAGRGFHSNDVRGVLGTVSAQGNASGAVTPFLSSTTGLELGLRTNLVPRLSLQVAAFQQDFGSELTYNADSGQTEPGAPSRRQGVEISAQYRPFRWLELNSDLAFSRPRYRAQALEAYGLSEAFIADAPAFIYSAGVLVNGLGRWSGAVQWRRLGTHSLEDGQQYPKDGGYSEWNLDVAYDAGAVWKLQAGIFNLFNSRGASASYYYISRLPGEPAEGVAGYQRHPMEPRSARFTIARMF